MSEISGGQPPLIVAGEAHVDMLEKQLAELNIDATIMIEPGGRDSAPALAAAAAWIVARDPDGVAAMVASDHHIPDSAAFRRAVETAAPVAACGAIVTFGVRPTYPSTAYGYIAAGDRWPDTPEIFAIKRFVEKPDADSATTYLEAGYLWNSGNFVFSASNLCSELGIHAPELRQIAEQAVEEAADSGKILRLSDVFLTAPKISIDYALMEKTASAAVLPVSFAWSDVGAWDAVWAALEHDDDGNAITGRAVVIDSQDSLVRASGRHVVVGIGLKRIGVIAERDEILVCDLASSQRVKIAVDQLKSLPNPIEYETGPVSAELGLDALLQRFRRWLFASALPLWWTLGTDHRLRGFREALDSEGRFVAVPLRTRVQARQAFVYALAGELGWPGPWSQAVEMGLSFLDSHYRRPDGLYRTLLTSEGEPADETAMVYDQAFVLLALAQAAKSHPRSAYESRALPVLEALQNAQAHQAGGFREQGSLAFQADPQMHLLEAALAWCEAGGGDKWGALADAQAELGLHKLIDNHTGVVKENYSADWTPAPGRDGRLLEPGHQFEWAWLLHRWGQLRSRPDAAIAARRLFSAGERGVDPRSGVAVNDLLDDFSVVNGVARLWPQTERLKAALVLADTEADPVQRTQYLASALQAGEALMTYFEGCLPGLWRDKRLPQGGFVDEPSPASSFYHIIGAFSALSASEHNWSRSRGGAVMAAQTAQP